jgi:hypothetical protein
VINEKYFESPIRQIWCEIREASIYLHINSAFSSGN